MSRLFFPNPAGPSSLPPIVANEERNNSSNRRIPPNNFNLSNSEARQAARILREPKSPFLPSRSGKEKDLSSYDLGQLTEMLERNTKLLATPSVHTPFMFYTMLTHFCCFRSITAALPGGDARLRAYQARLEARIIQLKGLQHIARDLNNTHLEPSDHMELTDATEQVNLNDDDGTEASSPQTKRRIMSSFSVCLRLPIYTRQ